MVDLFPLKYRARRFWLTFLGPAQLDPDRDPIQALEREREARYGPRPERSVKHRDIKRHFSEYERAHGAH